MTGNSGAPLEHLVHPAVCGTASSGAEPASRPGTYFFRKWEMGNGAEVGGHMDMEGNRSEPQGPQPTPRPTAAPGGAGREGGALYRP
jgi:hypothetical protein